MPYTPILVTGKVLDKASGIIEVAAPPLPLPALRHLPPPAASCYLPPLPLAASRHISPPPKLLPRLHPAARSPPPPAAAFHRLPPPPAAWGVDNDSMCHVDICVDNTCMVCVHTASGRNHLRVVL